MKSWTKYTFVCDPDECDTMIEVTCDNYGFPSGVMQITCPCGRTLQVLSVADATILPIPTTKEEKMEAPFNVTIEPMATTEYLQSQIDELKKQLVSHQNCDYWKSENGRIQSQLIDLINSAYENESDASEILESVCQIIDYNPVKTVQFEGVIHFSGAIDIPMNEVADFDLTSALEDVYVDINNGNVVIDNYELYSVEESY